MPQGQFSAKDVGQFSATDVDTSGEATGDKTAPPEVSPGLLERIEKMVNPLIRGTIASMIGVPTGTVGTNARAGAHLVMDNADLVGGTIGEFTGGPVGAGLGAAAGGVVKRFARDVPQVPDAVRDVYRNLTQKPTTVSKAAMASATPADRVRMSRGAVVGGTGEGLAQGIDEGQTAIAEEAALGAGGSLVGNQLTKAVANPLMRNAIGKLTPEFLKTFKTTTREIAQTMLDKGINVTERGMTKLDGLLGQTDAELMKVIGSLKGKVNPKQVARIPDVFDRFAARPFDKAADAADIRKVSQTYVKEHPKLLSGVEAQTEKREGYKQLKEAAYGQVGTAETEAKKGILRNIRQEIEGIAAKEGKGDVRALNDRERALLAAHDAIAQKLAKATYLSPADLLYATHHPVLSLLSLAEKTGLPVRSIVARAANNQTIRGVNSLFLRAIAAGFGAAGDLPGTEADPGPSGSAPAPGASAGTSTSPIR